jgi:hypothetical protein
MGDVLGGRVFGEPRHVAQWTGNHLISSEGDRIKHLLTLTPHEAGREAAVPIGTALVVDQLLVLWSQINEVQLELLTRLPIAPYKNDLRPFPGRQRNRWSAISPKSL